MSTKHTPGPWTVSPSAKASTLTRIFSVNEERLVASASGPGLSESGEAEANARLIASAPELLEEVCRLEAKIVKAMPTRRDDLTAVSITFTGGDLAAIRALIAKATL